jgi:hypothetical protein
MSTSPLFAPNYQQFAPNVSGLEITEFCIWNGQDAELVADHIYTQRDLDDDIFKGRLDIDSLLAWETRWPHLVDCITNELSVQGGLLLIKACLTLPPPNQPLDSAKLKTHLAVTVQEPCMGEVSVITRIYTMGQKVLELANVIPDAQTGKLYIPFAQEFWTAFLQGLRDLQQDATEKQRLREAKTVIGGITVVQEIWSEDRTQRIGLLCWEFAVDEDSKQPISVHQLLLPGQSSESSSFDVSPTYFPMPAAPFVAPAPQDEFARGALSTPGYSTCFPVTTFNSSPLAAYTSTSHLHPYSATLQRYSVSPMPTLEQPMSPLMIRPSSAPIEFGGEFSREFGGAEIVDAGAVVPSMDPGQGGLGIMGLEEETAWLEYTTPRQVKKEWEAL